MLKSVLIIMLFSGLTILFLSFPSYNDLLLICDQYLHLIRMWTTHAHLRSITLNHRDFSMPLDTHTYVNASTGTSCTTERVWDRFHGWILVQISKVTENSWKWSNYNSVLMCMHAIQKSMIILHKILKPVKYF